MCYCVWYEFCYLNIIDFDFVYYETLSLYFMVQIFRNFFHVLKRSLGASILNIAGLSVAFAVFTAILIQVDYEYSYNDSFPKADQIYRLEMKKESGNQYSSLVPKPFYKLIKSEIPELSFSCIIGKSFGSAAFTVVRQSGDMDFFEDSYGYTDTCVVRVFDLEVVAGDYRQALTEKNKLFLPLSLARKYFGGTDAVGKTVLFGGNREMTIAAVYRDVPSNSIFQNMPYSGSFNQWESWNQWNYDTYYVIPEGTDFQALEYKLRGVNNEITDRLGDYEIEFYPLKELYFANVRHVREASGNKAMTNVLLLIGCLILIVALVNFVNFSTALAPSRIKSLNTQKTFGATNRFLHFCIVSEAMMFALISCFLGFLWCYLLGTTSLQEALYASLNPLHHTELLFFIIGISFVVGWVAGCYPAFYMTSFPPALVLKGSPALSPCGVYLRNTLVVFQYVVSVALIIGILLISRQLEWMKNRSWGIDKEHVVFLKANGDIFTQRNAFRNELLHNSAIVNITSASELIGDVDMQHWFFNASVNGEDRMIDCDVCMVAPNYLDFFGLKVLEGDSCILPRDSTIMVNETFKEKYGFDPMGKEMAGMKVGRIVKDFNLLPLQENIRPLLLGIKEEWAHYFYIKINAAARNEALTHIRNTLHNFSPTYGYDVKFLDDHLNSLYGNEERLGKLVNVFGLATILIALMGVYGLVLFNAKFKAKEIGLRKVNGATNWQMVVLLNGTFLRLVFLSFVIACPLTGYALSFWLNSFAYRTTLSAGIFLLAGLIVLVITLLTISWQSWKAANANPVEVLRSE